MRASTPARMAVIALGALLSVLVDAADSATLLVPSEYAGIAAALGAAAAGDTVLIACGTYREHGLLLADGITVRGESGEPSCVVVDGDQAGTVFICRDAGTTTRLEAVTITGGWSVGGSPDYGGGGLDLRNASPVIERCVFTGNHAVGGGGACIGRQSAPLIIECEFEGNDSEMLGGGAASRQESPARFENCEFRGNHSYYGGGLYASSSAVDVERCRFIENTVLVYQETCDAYGAGLMLCPSNSRISDCVFERNVGSEDYMTPAEGGGIAVCGSLPAVVENCVFTGNRASRGGGASLFDADGTLFSSCTFEANETSGDVGGGICLFYGGSPTISNCVFRRNTSYWGGGAVGSWYECSPQLRDCLFQANASENGGGALWSAYGGSFTLDGCTIVSNSAPGGSGLQASGSTSFALSRCIIAYGRMGAAVSCASGVTLDCSDLFDNEGGDWTGCIADQLGRDGNFTADPLFCGAEAGDYTLSAASPCLPGQHPQGVDCRLIGALPQGCGVQAIQPATWGAVKELFQR